ncbi:MAG: hypothetical protein KER_02429 [Kerstersia gyiorum]
MERAAASRRIEAPVLSNLAGPGCSTSPAGTCTVSRPSGWLASPARCRALASLAGMLAVVLAGLSPLAAQAHPHMWIDASAEFEFDEAGRLAAVRQTWLFDEMFTAYALLGLEKKKDGSYSQATLAPLAQEWMEALAVPQTHFFSGLRRGGGDAPRLPFGPWRDASMAWHGDSGRISMTFDLPLKQPAAAGGQPLRLDVFDPTYYVAYDFSAPGAVTLKNAPAGCAHTYHPPNELDWQTAAKLAELPADIETLPEELFLITRSLSHRIELSCP